MSCHGPLQSRCDARIKYRAPVEARCGAWAAALLAVAGCSSMAPRYEPPTLPVAPRYADAGSTQGTAAAAVGWRDYFADVRLRALIAQALDNNRDLRSAVLHVAEARAAYRIQRSAEWPAIGVHAVAIRTLVPAGTLTGESLTLSEYEVGVSELSWEVDFWGRVRSLKDSALENFLATDAARRAATTSLVAQVAHGYLSLRELDERLVLARKTVASREESFRIFKRRYEVGSTSKLDLTQVETLLTQAQSLTTQLEQERAVQAHALTLLVGVPLDWAPGQGGVDDQSVLSELRVGLPSDLLTGRPDIVAAEHRLKAAHADIGAARAAFFPRVTLTGAFGSASADLDGLFGAGSRSWTFLPSISLPIFDAGRNRANLDLAKVRSDQAVASYEKTIQSAFREVSDALSARRWLTEQVRIQQHTLAVQTERARLATLRYDNGAAAFLEVLDAQRDLLSAEQQLVQTRSALLSSRVSLYAALGGGSMEFESRPPRSALLLPQEKIAP